MPSRLEDGCIQGRGRFSEFFVRVVFCALMAVLCAAMRVDSSVVWTVLCMFAWSGDCGSSPDGRVRSLQKVVKGDVDEEMR